LDKLKNYVIAALGGLIGLLAFLLSLSRKATLKARIQGLGASSKAEQEASDARLAPLKDNLSDALLEHQKALTEHNKAPKDDV